MKKLLTFLMLAALPACAQYWTNYPLVTVPVSPGDTFLLASTNAASLRGNASDMEQFSWASLMADVAASVSLSNTPPPTVTSSNATVALSPSKNAGGGTNYDLSVSTNYDSAGAAQAATNPVPAWISAAMFAATNPIPGWIASGGGGTLNNGSYSNVTLQNVTLTNLSVYGTVSGFPTAFTNQGIYYLFPPDCLANGHASEGVPASNTVYGVTVVLPYQLTISNVQFKTTGSGSGGLAGISIYNYTANGSGTRVMDTGPVSIPVNTTIATNLATPVTLPPGTYDVCWNLNNVLSTLDMQQLDLAGQLIANARLVLVFSGANAASAGQNPATIGTKTALSTTNYAPQICFSN